uniref:Uncharacterized protein n=1 Tax=Ditylenchus dipsaci TaxID=166011 RepID=A0A915CYC8_9BILA
MAPPLYDDSKYRCCCFHVEKAAYFIGFIGAVLNLIGALGYFLQRQWGQGGGAILSALLYILVLVAYHKRNPSFYLPFLVLKAIALVLYFLSILFLLVVFFVMPDWYVDRVRNEWIRNWPPGETYNEGDFKLSFRLWTGLLILMTAVITAVEAVFWCIIHKAYNYMKETE